jgi:pyruvate-formate lyase
MANRGRSRSKANKPADERPNAAPKSLADVLAKSTGTTASKKKPSARVEPQDKNSVSPEKVVEFPKPESNQRRPDRSDEVEELKRRVREAIDVLEQGKQVAAYNLLKRIVED